jgi:hypothetical protein
MHFGVIYRFGRDYETDEIVSLISAHKLVLVYAQSGAGKTSIFNAQVISRLERYGFQVLPIARVTIASTFTFNLSSDIAHTDIYNAPNIENLYTFNALQSLNPEIDSKLLINKSLSEFLNDYFPNSVDDNGEVIPQMLIFDQLEEIFSLCPNKWKEQQDGFFDQITKSLRNNSYLGIVLVIREEYLAQLDPYLDVLPEKLRPRFRLERLDEKAALSAIRGPLQIINVSFDEDKGRQIEREMQGIINDLLQIRIEAFTGQKHEVKEIKGKFVEPIQLQVVCQRWWRERQSIRRNSIEITNYL